MKDLKPIKWNKYSGRNTFSEITNLGPSEFRSISNWDIYGGMNGDYLRTRRGSEILAPEDPDVLPTLLSNKVVFSTPGGEYAVYNAVSAGAGSVLYGQSLAPGNPYRIAGPLLEVTTSTEFEDLELSGLTAANTDGFVLYFETVLSTGPTWTLQIYKDSGLTDLVASATSGSTGSINVTQENSSGITGTLELVLIAGGETGTIQYNAVQVTAEYDTAAICDLKVYNDRVYVFNQAGNWIVYYDPEEDRLEARPMGLEAPIINLISEGSGGDLPANGTWYYGVEKLIQKDGADYVASSPNRITQEGKLATVSTFSANAYASLILLSTNLDDDPYWTHVRLWRSKNATADFSDPLTPIDAQGTPDQLYEVGIITRAELEGAFGPIATSFSLPPGNAGIEAGISGGFITIQDNNDDSVLVNLIGIDLIGLIPLPGCRTGAVNKGRVWASGIGDDFLTPNTPNIDPTIREDALYTTELFSQYQEQWDPQAFLPAGRDGKETASIQVFMEDVIIFRQDGTRRVPSGNPDSLVQMLDDKIGVPTFRMTGFIPQIGICAICSDGYFRYLGFDQRWHQYIGKTEVSQSIYDLTAPVLTTKIADFVYMNGKLLMLIPSGGVAALGVKEGKGWGLYDYLYDFQIAFNFGDNNRAALGASGGYLLEIETSATTDTNPFFPETTTPITASFEGAAISGEGQLLDVTQYSFWGKLTSVPTVTAKSSNLTWQMRSMFIDPGLFAATTELNEREYIFQPSPTNVTPFEWLPLRGQFISFLVTLEGPAMISWQSVKAKLRNTKGNLGVYDAGGIIPQGPGWINSSVMILNFEDPGDTFYDASGKGLNHVWAAGSAPIGTKTNRVTQKPGKGVRFTPNGSLSCATDTSAALMGTMNLTWQMAFSFSTGAVFVSSGKSGNYSWRLLASAASVRMDLDADGVEHSYIMSGFTPTAGVTYALTFALTTELEGQFYMDNLAGSFSGPRTTTRGNTIILPAIPDGHTIRAAQVSATNVTVSYYTIDQSDCYEEQANRFFGLMQAY